MICTCVATAHNLRANSKQHVYCHGASRQTTSIMALEGDDRLAQL